MRHTNYIVFNNTTTALRFENACHGVNCVIKLVPVPRELSLSCGLACTYRSEDTEKLKRLIEEQQFEGVRFIGEQHEAS